MQIHHCFHSENVIFSVALMYLHKKVKKLIYLSGMQ